jgi:hypothetical protein
MLQMPNAAAQLVVDLLFWCGVLLFFRGIREDVLREFFSSKDFFEKQVKTEKTERGKPRDRKQEQEAG